MQIGLGVLKWPPAAFWSATPHDLQAAIEAVSGRRPDRRAMTRAEFEDLKLRLGVTE